ncbi:hypothetical protein DEJ45_26240 [Streptomyces venezuelae]|uniref:hypothetical protein n=1 Tax=Streptomyces venezuelae TaxID=54571 RepID=UPI0012A9EDAF|nr:hypothetical protein [Streptomyces venezuelae]QES15530.1 hypothetical protein DEJ45_26240 [Streptomyces venezuelae]
MSGSLWLKPPTTPLPAQLPLIPRPRRENAPGRATTTATPRPSTGATGATGPAGGTGETATDGTPTGDTGGALATDPIDELAERLDGFAAVAVHPDEIAAILESDGMTDDHIRLAYGRADSFTLAEDLYARVERRHPAPAAPPGDAWHAGLAGCLLRGLVFALPGLAYVLAAPLLAGEPGRFGLPGGTVPLLAGAVTGWVWNQALSHRAYTWLGLGDRRAAARALLVGAPAGALVGTAVALATAAPGETPAALFAAGQSLYLAAATVLLVLGRERALLCALSPLAGAVPAFRWDLPDPVRAALLLTALTASAALAAAVLRPGVRRGAAGRGGPPRAASLPYGLFGLGSGLLVLQAGVGDTLVSGAGAVVALTLSMGPAEWLLHRFRGESLSRLRTLTTAREFRRAVTGTLVLCLGGYLTVLVALTLAATLAWPGAPLPEPARLVTLLLIGTVLWLGLLLQAFGAVLSAAAVCLLAAAAETVEPAAGPVAAGGAAAVLAVLTCVLLVRPTAHRV